MNLSAAKNNSAQFAPFIFFLVAPTVLNALDDLSLFGREFLFWGGGGGGGGGVKVHVK